MKSKINPAPIEETTIKYPCLMTPKASSLGLTNKLVVLFTCNNKYTTIVDEALGKDTTGFIRNYNYDYNPLEDWLIFKGEVILSNDG